MDYSPPLSPLSSPESIPPASPPYYIDEPKTLTEQQLNAFRLRVYQKQFVHHLHKEAALQIINTHTPEEATRIFMEGFIPVDGVKPKTLSKEKKASETDENVKKENQTP